MNTVAKPFARGLVIGKFSPLHRGHELVVQCAFSRCREVLIISYSVPEFAGCEAAKREKWLADLFPEARRLVISTGSLRDSVAGLKELDLPVPPNRASDAEHRQFVGLLCTKILGLTVDAVFTSEEYGVGLAQELTACFRWQDPSAMEVCHVMVDSRRTQVPVSGSRLREDLEQHRHWLSPAVYASFVKRICLLGGESSGKSTLAAALARHFGTVHVGEYGRELWEARNGVLAFEDMVHIAETQISAEGRGCLHANRFLFCDTSPLTTLFYSQHLFHRVAPKLERLAGRDYHLAILCGNEFDFVQDGTRRDAKFREIQAEWFVRQLTWRRMPFLQVSGSVEDRITQINNHLSGAAAKGPPAGITGEHRRL